MTGAVLAYSGGVDSTLLLSVGKEVLGENFLAVTAASDTYPKEEIETAKQLARRFGVRHRIINTFEIRNPRFRHNPPERCYYCKKELFTRLRTIGEKEGLTFLIDGSNKDDLKDFRPGLRANKDLGVRSPLQEAGFTKEMIRELSKELGLPNHDKPSLACLASRVPYGEKITKVLLKKLDSLERYLKKKDFKTVRVRHHGPIARIEVGGDDLKRLIEMRINIVRRFKREGYKYITVDLEGFRSGSMNLLLRV